MLAKASLTAFSNFLTSGEKKMGRYLLWQVSCSSSKIGVGTDLARGFDGRSTYWNMLMD